MPQPRLGGGIRTCSPQVQLPVMMYPLLLVEAGNKGHITEAEFSELYVLHEHVERARKARAGNGNGISEQDADEVKRLAALSRRAQA